FISGKGKSAKAQGSEPLSREFPGSPGSSPFRTALPIRSAVPALIRVTSARLQAGKDRRLSGPNRGGSNNSRAQGAAVVPRREQHMSFKSKVLAGAASLALVGGVAVAGGLSANAATPSCGDSCINIFSRDFGPSFFMDVFRQGVRVGQPIILFKQSNHDP